MSGEKVASDSASGHEAEAEAEAKGKAKGGLKSYFRVFAYADSLSWLLNAAAFVAAIAAGSVLPLMNLIFGKFVTTFTNFATGKLSPAGYSLIFVYLFVAKFALTYVHTVCISIAALRTTKALRIDFLHHTLRQNVAYFDSADSTSVSIQATTNGNNVNTGVSEKLTLTISGISTFVAAFVVAFAVQPKLAGITVSIVPTILIVIGTVIGIDTKNENQMLSLYSKAGLLAEEVFASMRTVHSFWLHPIMTKRYASILDEAQKVGLKKSPSYMVMFSTEFFCVLSGYALAFWKGIHMYASGEISASGDVVTVIFAVIVAATAMTTIAPQVLAITKASAAAGELFATIDRESEIDAMSVSGKKPHKCIGDIKVRGVHFAYPTRKDAKVLQGLDLDLSAGKSTALVGASGSGKSTIIGLLERWYDFPDGEILLDGHKIRDLNIAWLRTNIRLVQQEPVLFNGTVFENVSYGLLGTKSAGIPQAEQRELVMDACKAAYAHEFIEQLPGKYNTKVGERAGMLSGGQKQRLAIARSIISNPKVLLLDEATSALDPKAERIVQKALDNVSTNRTTLVIAHKLSTVRNCESIAVMSNGAIIEQGAHDNLIAADGAYARLVKAQDLGNGGSADHDESNDKEVGSKLGLARTPTREISSYVNRNSATDKVKGLNYSLVRCVWILLREQKKLYYAYVILSLAAILGGLTYPAQAILFSRALNAFQLQGTKATGQGDFYSLMFFVVALGNLLVYGIIGWFCNVIAQSTSRKYRLELFENTLRQDMDFFDKDENGTGAIVSKLSSYPNNLVELLGFNLMLILINTVNVVSSSALALIVGWKLGLVVVFGALPALLFAGYLRIRLEFKLDDNVAEKFASSASLAAEAVAAIRTVASLTLEKHILNSYQDRLSNVVGKSIKALVWTMFWYSLTQSISFLAMGLGFWYGGRLVSTGEYTNSQFYIVFIGVIFSGEAAAAFFSYTTSITKAQTAANHIFWFRTQIPTMREDLSKEPRPHEKEDNGPTHIQSEELNFAYTSRPSHTVINDINFDIRPGQFAALVGPSGCGKSTIISLLSRFYDPISGRILSNGAPINTLCPRRYRRSIALVQQEPVLYQGSIRDNIAMGFSSSSTSDDNTTDATEAGIESACRQANIDDFISSLPAGLSTLCGSRGIQLSGGQRQRIAIARALIRRPRLLLLDEATSALDTESERVVQAALEKAQDGRTTIAVAHRLSTIKNADCIFVFSKGRIVEMGSHSELLARRGVYWEMCKGQGLDQSAQ